MGVSLGLVGIVDKGIYNPDETYNKGNFILHEGSTWLALKNNLQGVEPAEGESWKFLARGFAAEILSLITAVDSAGLVGNAGAETDGQTLLDAIADKVANQLLEKKMMSNVQVNDATMVPTSALAYAMQQAITQLNSNKENFIKFIEYTVTDSVTIESLKGESWNVNSVIPEGYRVMCCNLVYGTSSTTGAIAQLLTDIVNDNLIVCFNKYSKALTFSSLTFRIYVIKK